MQIKKKPKLSRLRRSWTKLKHFIKRKVIPRAIVYGGLIVTLNYLVPSMSFSTRAHRLRKYINDRGIQRVCMIDSHLEDIAASIDSKNCGVLPFVKSAHFMAARHLSYELYEGKSHAEELTKALEEGKADCSYFSTFTYSNFLHLADRLGRQDLKDKVRLCRGYVADEGHAWLQVSHNGKWSNYEATVDLLEREDEIDFRFLNTIPDKIFLPDSYDYQPFSYTQFEDGKLTNHTDFLSALKYDKGLWW